MMSESLLRAAESCDTECNKATRVGFGFSAVGCGEQVFFLYMKLAHITSASSGVRYQDSIETEDSQGKFWIVVSRG